MKILAVETSCDDTCISIVKTKNQISKIKNFEILSNIVSSQVKLHAKYGGVYPSLAKREHQKNLPIILRKALRTAKNPKVDLIAVTVGPGLEPCLWVGVNFAKELAKKLKLPLIPVNHIESHILASWLTPIGSNSKLFPAICLVVSGGHTQLIIMKGLGKYKIIGETRDDAAGECFDKTARILGLGYPGGPIVAKMAAKFKMQNVRCGIKLPRPMIYQKNYDFSFSGLKTAVLYLVRQLTVDNKQLTMKQVRKICAEVQQAIIDVLIHKTLKAAKEYKVKAIILGGGVASNQELRKQIKQRVQKEIPNAKCLIPDAKYCTDNAVMTAVTGYFSALRFARVGDELRSSPSFRVAKAKAEKKKPSLTSPFAGARVIEADANLRL